ncbi:hypothetical protein EB809_06090 [Marinobacter sp. R17]|uniref:Ig-like domain-containing protein n=1 Tax=Marinobacter sp. R17 TaxID=2484250 RepID=UPI000F4CB452|nr:Ig-like domain-containing protein [Marinobacter sp. R17]ROU00685.1 hypothetical protein EB809_06090 [Marinobacter sp. R17]
MIKKITFLCLFALLSACGGGGSDSSTSSAAKSPVLVGRFMDSAVEGVSFKTPTISGVTNAEGEFRYREGEAISFSIGNILLNDSAVIGKPILTPVSLAGAKYASNRRAILIMRFLQSLDKDQDPSNGIVISEDVSDIAKNYSVVFTDEVELSDVKNIVANLTLDGRSLVDENDALSHYFKTAASLSSDRSGISDLFGTPQITQVFAKPIMDNSSTVRIIAKTDFESVITHATIRVGESPEFQMNQENDPSKWVVDLELAEVEGKSVTIYLKSTDDSVLSLYFNADLISSDIDNDGVGNSTDAFPFDGEESVDTDNDGVGNNADDDDDGDGTPDEEDDAPLDSSVANASAPQVLFAEPLDDGAVLSEGLTIRAIFDKDMAQNTINLSTVSLKTKGKQVSVSVNYDAQTRTVFLIPEDGLSIEEEYKASLDADISDMEGNSLEADFEWNFYVQGQWGIPKKVSPDVITRSYFKFSADNDGDGILTWTTFDGVVYKVWAQTLDKSGNAIDLVNIAESNNQIYDNSIIHLADGSAMLFWVKYIDGCQELRVSSYNEQSGWSQSQLLYRSDITADLSGIQSAFNTAGQGVLSVGVKTDSPNDEYLLGIVYDGQMWGSPVKLSGESGGFWGWVDVDIDEDGNALVAWDATINREAAKVTYYDSNVGWSEVKILSSDTSQSPQVAFVGPGEAIAVWGDFAYSGQGVQWARFTSETGWSEHKKLADGSDIYNVSLSSDYHGRAIATWSFHSNAELYASEYIDGEGWGNPHVLDTMLRDVSNEIEPIPAGGFAVIWRKGDFMEYSDIKTAIYKNGNWEDTIIMNDGTQYVGRVGLDVLSNGEIWANWEEGVHNNPGLVIRKFQ